MFTDPNSAQIYIDAMRSRSEVRCDIVSADLLRATGVLAYLHSRAIEVDDVLMYQNALNTLKDAYTLYIKKLEEDMKAQRKRIAELDLD